MESQYLQFMQTPEMMDALRATSRSNEDANLRAYEYAKMFSRNDEMKENAQFMQKSFSGYAETPLLSTQYFNASVASYVSSFAGYMSIEKDFDQPNGLFYWFDVLGVSDMRNVIPNLGPDSIDNIQTTGNFVNEVTVVSGTQAYTSLIARKLIPGTVRVKVVDYGNSGNYDLIDNGQGQFMSVAGVLVSGKINYLAGKVEFTLSNKPADDSTDTTKKAKITIVGKEDVTGTPCNTVGASNVHANDKRFTAKMQQLMLNTVPDMLVAEYNIAALGAMKKATNSDMATFLFNKLRELYTKCINRTLVTTLDQKYMGMDLKDENPLDLASTSTDAVINKFHDYRSRVDLFEAYMVDVEAALTQKSVKTCDITAFVAGKRAANQFQKGSIIGKWERNTKMTYINDLLGWYNGIPVLRSEDVNESGSKEGTFYAIHKTVDGQMAPLARGIYMPLTDTPTVGNYNNPTQMAAGIYYQEGIGYLAQELVQKVTFGMGL